jgi:two-component system nitrogen regulation response regulator NtrX
VAQVLPEAGHGANGTSAAATSPTAESLDGVPLSEALDRYERQLISAALTHSDGNVAEAARRLQTDRPNLYRRMRRLGLASAGE